MTRSISKGKATDCVRRYRLLFISIVVAALIYYALVRRSDGDGKFDGLSGALHARSGKAQHVTTQVVPVYTDAESMSVAKFSTVYKSGNVA